MQIDFYFLAKLFLLLYIWALIAFCILFILKSRNFSLSLKECEKACVCKKIEWAKKKKDFKIVLSSSKNSLKDLLLFAFPGVSQGYVFYSWIRTGFNLTRKTLR